MNPKEPIPKPDESLEDLDMDTSPTVDDFIKELEAKEKDLHITSDLKIEVTETDFDPDRVPDFIAQDLSVPPGRMGIDGSNGSPGGLKTRIYELQQEIAALKEKNASLRMDRNDIQEKSDRRLKDFESYRYRMDRERRGAFIDQISNLASQLLPVLDNLDRALDSVETSKSKRNVEFQQFYEGIVLVNQQVNEVLSEMGVQPIATVGEPFDPNMHEAVATEESTDLAPNTVSAEMLRGYRIGNRVVRHSMVKVTKAPSTSTSSAVDLDPFPDDLSEDLVIPDDNSSDPGSPEPGDE
jgi:molecular chaperone GrpE